MLICDAFNPTLFYLTREAPNYLCEDKGIDADMSGFYGGNIIRMLIPTPLVSFRENDTIDTGEIKGDLMTEIADQKYTNNPETRTNLWNE